jgi:hypothetical protein
MLIITQGEEAKATTGISCYVTSPLGYLELWKGTNKHPSPPPQKKEVMVATRSPWRWGRSQQIFRKTR